MSDNIFPCTGCKHSRIKFFDWILTVFSTERRSREYHCIHRSNSYQHIDHVTGKIIVTKSSNGRCQSRRWDNSPGGCGYEGRYWSPKHKKDLFLFMKKDIPK